MRLVFSESLLVRVYQGFIHEDSLVKSEALVVLTGSHTGNRMKAAAKLYYEGFAKKLVFSGFLTHPETYTSTLMKNYALKSGFLEMILFLRFPTKRSVPGVKAFQT